MNDKLDLSIDINQIIHSVTLKKTVIALAATIGVVGTLTPLFVKQLDKESKTMLLFAGLIGNITASALPRNTKDEKIKKLFDKTVNDNYANQLTHEVYRVNAQTEIKERNELADYIDNDVKVPAFQKMFWAKKFGVVDLMKSFFISENIDTPDEPEQEYKPVLPQSALNSSLQKVATENEVNLNWIPEIVPQSKIIVGARKSGKSRFMRYLLADYILTYPTDEWFVIDPHYEAYENSEEFDKNNPENAWLLGVEPELLKNRIIDNVQDGYTKITEVYGILRDRISKKTKYPKVPRIMLFIDEFEAYKKGLSDEQFENVIEFIEVAQDEGRKFGVEATIGMHSLKKERTGIDSTVIAQMYWLLFENAASDRATVFPADFDQKQIVRALKKVNQTKDKKKFRSFVLTSPDGSLLINLLPLLPLPTFRTDSGNDSNEPTNEATTAPAPTTELTDKQKAYTVLKEWVDSQTIKPDALTVREGWKKLTGETLNEKGLQYLLEKLGLN